MIKGNLGLSGSGVLQNGNTELCPAANDTPKSLRQPHETSAQESDNSADVVTDYSSGESFERLMKGLIEEYPENEEYASKVLFSTSRDAEIGFIEGVCADELQGTFNQLEQKIGSFIVGDSRGGLVLGLLGEDTIGAVRGVYNSHNMLFFARQLAEESYETLSTEHTDMLFRYYTVLRILQDHQAKHSETLRTSVRLRADLGGATWAGCLRSYGVSDKINPSDYSSFHNNGEFTDVQPIYVDGERVKVNGEVLYYE